jgi:hypothetical protein
MYQGLEQDEGHNLQDLSEHDQEAVESPITYSPSTLIPGTLKSTIYVGIVAVLFSICRYFVRLIPKLVFRTPCSCLLLGVC